MIDFYGDKMEVTSEQPIMPPQDAPANAEQEQHADEPMEESDEYGYDNDEHRQHFVPRGRGGFR